MIRLMRRTFVFNSPPAQQPQQPGKLNLKNFAIVNDAIARMNVNEGGGSGGGMSQSTSADTGRGKGGLAGLFNTMTGGGSSSSARAAKQAPPPIPPPKGGTGSNQSTFAPHSNAAYTGLAGLEDCSDDDGEAEYAQVQEIYPGADGGGMMGMGMSGMGGEQHMYTFSQDTTPNKGNKMRPTRARGPMEKGPQTLGGSKFRVCLFVLDLKYYSGVHLVGGGGQGGR